MAMAGIGRRGFVKGATVGALAFAVGGVEIIMTAHEARARGVPFRLLDLHQGETLEALGETLVPQAREAGIAHFIDQQLSVPANESLLQARIFNFRPPFAEFYRAAIVAVDAASDKMHSRDFAKLAAAEQYAFVNLMRQNKVEGWAGPSGAQIYAVLRADAVDVVYGTMEGYEALGIPYMPHIPPEKRW
jgi:gluconate 2-dehydrogenase subunit 3-like protein